MQSLEGTPRLQRHYTEEEARRSIRAYVTTLLGSLRCRTDVQVAGGKGMLLRYVTSHVTKMHDASTSKGLRHLDESTMPPNIRHFVQAVHLCPDRWGSCDQIRSQFEHKGHRSIFLTTIVAFVLSLHDILHLWCLQVVDGRIGCLHAQPVDQLYPLLPHQEAMFNDVVDSLAQRRRFLD